MKLKILISRKDMRRDDEKNIENFLNKIVKTSAGKKLIESIFLRR